MFKRMVLELGGKSAAIILDDADLDMAIAAADVGNFRNTGQACIGLTRVLAPRKMYAQVVDGLADRARAYVLGDPLEDSTTMGPVVAKRQRDRILAMLDGARAEGAKLAAGGGRPAGQPHGWFVEPTVIAGPHQLLGDRAGGAFRSGCDRNCLRRRRSGGSHGQRLEVRFARRRLLQRFRARARRRAPGRVGYRRRELLRACRIFAVRRYQELRHRPRVRSGDL